MPPSQQLTGLGLESLTASVQGCGGRVVFPNAWWQDAAHSAKAYCRVRDITWAALRHADYSHVSQLWGPALLGLLMLAAALQP